MEENQDRPEDETDEEAARERFLDDNYLGQVPVALSTGTRKRASVH